MVPLNDEIQGYYHSSCLLHFSHLPPVRATFYVIFTNRGGVLYWDLKHELRVFLNGLKNKPLNTLIREESLKTYLL